MKTETININHADRAKELLLVNQTIVIVRDADNAAWASGWADYLMNNYEYSNLNSGFRVNLEKPKK